MIQSFCSLHVFILSFSSDSGMYLRVGLGWCIWQKIGVINLNNESSHLFEQLVSRLDWDQVGNNWQMMGSGSWQIEKSKYSPHDCKFPLPFPLLRVGTSPRVVVHLLRNCLRSLEDHLLLVVDSKLLKLDLIICFSAWHCFPSLQVAMVLLTTSSTWYTQNQQEY